MSRIRALFVSTLSMVALAAALVSSSALAAPGADGTTTISSAGFVAHRVVEPRAAVDYWTADRMRAARPLDLLDASRLGRGAHVPEGPHRTGILSPRNVARHPHAAAGKVFFTLNSFDFVCSASAVTSAGSWGEGPRNLVVTAGHCVNNGFGGFASSWVFAPGYTDGVAPHGLWPAEVLTTTNEWNSGAGAALGRDVAFAQLAEGTGDYAGYELHDVIEPLGIVFTERYPEDGIRGAVRPKVGTRYASLGYGVLNWGGEDQVRTVSRSVFLDPIFSPSPIGIPSTHTGGSSGGPWLYRYRQDSTSPRDNAVNSVNSYVYGGIDVIFGPQFDDLIHGLWEFSANL